VRPAPVLGPLDAGLDQRLADPLAARLRSLVVERRAVRRLAALAERRLRRLLEIAGAERVVGAPLHLAHDLGALGELALDAPPLGIDLAGPRERHVARIALDDRPAAPPRRVARAR